MGWNEDPEKVHFVGQLMVGFTIGVVTSVLGLFLCILVLGV